jgi:MFS transporter, PPP family, 3-phenylpropionic acid transporter
MINNQHLSGVPYWRLSGFYFLFFVTVGIFLPYWSLYLKSIGMDARHIGILSAILVFSKVFTSYFWGWIVDHTGRRIRVIQLASLFSVISFSAALFVQSFWGLAIILFVFSLFWSASLPQIEAATLTHLGDSSHAYTSIRVWGSVSFIITVWLLGVLFEYISIANVPSLILVSMVVVWLISLFIPEQISGEHDHDHENLRVILFRPQVLALFVVCFLMLASHGPYYTFYSIYLEDNGYSSTIIGQMWALGVIAEVVLFMMMRRLVGIFSLKNLMIASLLLAGLRWLLIGFFIDSLLLLIIAQLFHAATFGLYHAVAIQYIHKFFRGRLQGRGQALYSSVSFGAGMAIGSLVSGYVWDRAGAVDCFAGAALLALIAAVIASLWIND